MPTLLHLDSSADLERSRSRALTATFAHTWAALGDDHAVVRRDLHVDPLPHLADAALHWPPRLRQPGSTPSAAAEELQRRLIDELLSADVVLVGAPMYNYAMPSSLKAWIDHIHVPGLTSPFDEPTRPMAGRYAVIVTARGASYDPGSPTDGWDHDVPALQLIFGESLGMVVHLIATNLTLAQDQPLFAEQLERADAELAAGQLTAAALARELG